MGIISNIYLLIFLPLIAAIFCQLIAKKSFTFFVALAIAIIEFLLAIKIFPQVIFYERIANDLHLSLLSLGLEFNLDILGIIFIILIIFIKITTLCFFKSDIEKFLNKKGGAFFYPVFLLQIFSLIGIFSSNNLLNLFLFFEIYSFSLFAISSISYDLEIAKLSFKSFCLSATSSLLILLCFLSIYLTFGEINFDEISNNISLNDKWFSASIFLVLALAFTIKFFLFNFYFTKLKNQNLTANFLAIDSLFIQTNVGIFLALKFIFLFFNIELFAVFKIFFIILALAIILYSSLKLYLQRHLEFISAYFCLNNFGFIVLAFTLQTVDSLQALFFYLINFSIVNLFIFTFAIFLKKHYNSSSISKINLIDNLFITLPFKILLLFLAAFPLTIMFFANWHMIYGLLKIDLEIFLLAILIIANFSNIAIVIKLITPLFDRPHELSEVAIKKSYAIAFWLMIVTICLVSLMSGLFNNISLRFAAYLISNNL